MGEAPKLWTVVIFEIYYRGLWSVYTAKISVIRTESNKNDTTVLIVSVVCVLGVSRATLAPQPVCGLICNYSLY